MVQPLYSLRLQESAKLQAQKLAEKYKAQRAKIAPYLQQEASNFWKTTNALLFAGEQTAVQHKSFYQQLAETTLKQLNSRPAPRKLRARLDLWM